MTTIYFKNENGRKVEIRVTDKVADALAELRREEWRVEAAEQYHRAASLDALADAGADLGDDSANPESVCLAAAENTDLRDKVTAALAALTPDQLRLVKLLRKNKRIGEIARILGKDKRSVSDMKARVQKKFKAFLTRTNA
jgi:DNA-binding CsgD family transcriptional regulator